MRRERATHATWATMRLWKLIVTFKQRCRELERLNCLGRFAEAMNRIEDITRLGQLIAEKKREEQGS